jgi:ureidoglycolate lyase
LPDLKNLRAFVANGGQAVTYGAGTWHAPMIVIGDRPIDFVVVQFANEVGNEDCQEIMLKPNQSASEGVVVMVDTDSVGAVQVKAGVGSVKAKL